MIGSSKSAFEGGACHTLSLGLFSAAHHPSLGLAVQLQGWVGARAPPELELRTATVLQGPVSFLGAGRTKAASRGD